MGLIDGPRHAGNIPTRDARLYRARVNSWCGKLMVGGRCPIYGSRFWYFVEYVMVDRIEEKL